MTNASLPPTDSSATATLLRRRVALVTNIPAPYRIPVYEALAVQPDVHLRVFYCSGREPDREWELKHSGFEHEFLRDSFITVGTRFIHFNPDVWAGLSEFKPDVVITTGFNPTHIIAFVYAKMYGLPHIAMTDGTLTSEGKLTVLHRFARRVVYAGSRAFVGASQGSFDLYASYGIRSDRMFKSHLCADNERYAQVQTEKKFDFLFCGRFVDVKNPLFALQVAHTAAKRLGRRVTVAMAGSGPLLAAAQEAARAMQDDVQAHFPGFVQQDQLPALYGGSKVFLFPTSWDPWGVVSNEACAAGVPTLITPEAGSANELIADGVTGYVLGLNVVRWAQAACQLLTQPELYARMSAAARERVQPYTFRNAASGLAQAVQFALTGEEPDFNPVLRPQPRRSQVLIIQRRLTHYRVPLFNELRRLLNSSGIDLHIVYGTPTVQERHKKDSGELDWGEYVPCKYWLDGRLCWQDARAQAKQADLVVVTQENKLLFNYILPSVAPRSLRAFWGHGRNFQSARPQLSEWVKSYLSRHVDWWFAYTQVSADIVTANGFPADRVTALNNTFDTSGLRQALGEITEDARRKACEKYGLHDGPIGLMLGSLYVDKRVDVLLQAAYHVRQRIPDFQLVIAGDGPQRELVQQAVTDSGGWIHWLGAVGGQDKAVVLSLATVILNPGMVGLTVIDSLTAGVPMITMDSGLHSPEIVYLKSGVNGLITPNDLASYANAVADLLQDPRRLAELRAGCALEAGSLSIEEMAYRFCVGIQKCLALRGSAVVKRV